MKPPCFDPLHFTIRANSGAASSSWLFRTVPPIANIRNLSTLSKKLTGAGMTFLDTDVIQVLEEVLPSRFGGAPTDYQLIEEENETGEPVLRLLVRPELGAMDEAAVAQTFLQHLSHGSGVSRVMGLVWMKAGLVKVERRAPLSTSSGKILHLFLNSPKNK